MQYGRWVVVVVVVIFSRRRKILKRKEFESIITAIMTTGIMTAVCD